MTPPLTVTEVISVFLSLTDSPSLVSLSWTSSLSVIRPSSLESLFIKIADSVVDLSLASLSRLFSWSFDEVTIKGTFSNLVLSSVVVAVEVVAPVVLVVVVAVVPVLMNAGSAVVATVTIGCTKLDGVVVACDVLTVVLDSIVSLTSTGLIDEEETSFSIGSFEADSIVLDESSAFLSKMLDPVVETAISSVFEMLDIDWPGSDDSVDDSAPSEVTTFLEVVSA